MLGRFTLFQFLFCLFYFNHNFPSTDSSVLPVPTITERNSFMIAITSTIIRNISTVETISMLCYFVVAN